MARSSALGIALVLIFATSAFAQLNKTIFIGLDGVRADGLISASTPNIDSLIAGAWAADYHCAYGYNAMTIRDTPQLTTVEGVPSIQCGVTYAKQATYNTHYLTTIETAAPALNTVSLAGGVTGIDYGVGGLTDAAQASQAAAMIAGTYSDASWSAGRDVDAMWLWLGNPDEEGHGSGFSPSSSEGYLEAIHAADTQVGQVLTAIRNRPHFANENWQVILTTDHGGQFYTHGALNPQNWTIPLVVSSKEAKQGQMAGVPRHYDVAATAVTHVLGAAAIPSYYDGVDRSQNVVAQPAGLAQDLRVYLRFDGNGLDSSGRGNNAAVGANSDHDPALLASGGKFGGCVQINNYGGGTANSSYLTLGTPADLNFGATGSYSIALWWRPHAAPQGTRGFNPTILGNKDANWVGSVRSYAGTAIMGNDSDGRSYGFGLNVADGSAARDFRPAPDTMQTDPAAIVPAYTAGVWYFLAATFDRSGEVTFHVGTPDGKMWVLGDFFDIGSVDSPLPWNIGQDGTGNRNYNLDGDIDDLAIWGRALTLEEIRRLYNDGAGLELAAAIPEPASLSLLAAGAAALLRRRRDGGRARRRVEGTAHA